MEMPCYKTRQFAEKKRFLSTTICEDMAKMGKVILGQSQEAIENDRRKI